MAAVYASNRPDTVEQLFLVSPGGTSSYEKYDPYSMRDLDDLTKETVSASKVDQWNRDRLEKKQPYEEFSKYIP